MRITRRVLLISIHIFRILSLHMQRTRRASLSIGVRGGGSSVIAGPCLSAAAFALG